MNGGPISQKGLLDLSFFIQTSIHFKIRKLVNDYACIIFSYSLFIMFAFLPRIVINNLKVNIHYTRLIDSQTS